MADHFNHAAIAIGFALLFDMLDGRIARLTKTTTEIGIQLDSIADVVTFGLAPAMLAYVWGYGVTLTEGRHLHRLAWFLSFMYLMCGAFRLARFNVQASRPRMLAEGTVKSDKKSFVGLPIPVAGGLIAALVHFSPVPLIALVPERRRIYAGLLMVLVGLLSVMMVSTLRFLEFQDGRHERPQYAHDHSGAGSRNADLSLLAVRAAGDRGYVHPARTAVARGERLLAAQRRRETKIEPNPVGVEAERSERSAIQFRASVSGFCKALGLRLKGQQPVLGCNDHGVADQDWRC